MREARIEVAWDDTINDAPRCVAVTLRYDTVSYLHLTLRNISLPSLLAHHSVIISMQTYGIIIQAIVWHIRTWYNTTHWIMCWLTALHDVIPVSDARLITDHRLHTYSRLDCTTALLVSTYSTFNHIVSLLSWRALVAAAHAWGHALLCRAHDPRHVPGEANAVLGLQAGTCSSCCPRR